MIRILRWKFKVVGWSGLNIITSQLLVLAASATQPTRKPTQVLQLPVFLISIVQLSAMNELNLNLMPREGFYSPNVSY